ncbi:MAG: hypothetical protein Q9162_006273 [Coniocarpon cinnabarinum]
MLVITNQVNAGNMVPSYFFCGFENRLGIIIAGGPILRQLYVYRKKTKTYLPTAESQHPNQDIEKLHFRVNMRDIICFKRSVKGGGPSRAANVVIQGTPKPPPDPRSDILDAEKRVRESALDVWKRKITNFLGSREPQKVSQQLQHNYKHLQNCQTNKDRVDEIKVHTEEPLQNPAAGEAVARCSRSRRPWAVVDSLEEGTNQASLENGVTQVKTPQRAESNDSAKVVANHQPMHPSEDINLAEELSSPRLMPMTSVARC